MWVSPLNDDGTRDMRVKKGKHGSCKLKATSFRLTQIWSCDGSFRHFDGHVLMKAESCRLGNPLFRQIVDWTPSLLSFLSIPVDQSAGAAAAECGS